LEVRSSYLNFRISLVDVDLLKPHEDVIESIVKTIADDMLSEGLVRDPLIVDQEEYVILDGMHRFSSLKQLNCRFAPCCLLNYDSDRISVDSWVRLFNVQEPESLAQKLLMENHLNFSQDKVKDQNKPNPRTIILTANGIEFSLTDNMDPIEQSRAAVRLEKQATTRGYAVDYESKAEALKQMDSGKTNFVIWLPIFTKQQIRSFGLAGTLLPHKVTRHVIPSRPLLINIPLDLLRNPTLSTTDADRKVGEILSERHIERKPPGSIVDGRRYEEELLVFSS
jgi:hypothetical protein